MLYSSRAFLFTRQSSQWNQISPSQEQSQDPPVVNQVASQEPSSPSHDASQDQDQDQPSIPHVEDSQVDQVPHTGQDGDTNDQDDQEFSPRNNEEIKAHRIARRARALKNIDVSLDKVADKLASGRTTKGQLARFSENHAHISMVEPKKVFEALEDYDWVEDMHDELNNFKRNNVWELVEKPKDCLNVIGTKWIFKNK